MDQRAPRQTAAPQSPQTAARAVFNCVVDDTALVAGVKRSTRNGLRQWVKNAQIRLFVPLYALEQLSGQKAGDSRHAEDVRETLEWLDDATSRFPEAVTLQGGDETFEEWSEVAKFVVPRSLFSEHDHDLSSSPEASRSANAKKDSKSDDCESVPQSVQPLFNYLLWRINQEVDPAAALESFIFLCNDTAKVELAKGFGVRCKRLEQLRDAISRADRDARGHQTTALRSAVSISSLSDEPPSPAQSPPTAPAAMSPKAALMDPHTFGRSPVMTHASPQSSRGRGGGGRGSMKGRGRGSMLTSPKQTRVDLNFGFGHGQGDGFEEAGPEIDPNSFERPRGGHIGRGGRRLWTPG